METQEAFYRSQRIRYRVQGGVFEINTEDICMVLGTDRKSVSPSGLDYVYTSIAVGAAVDCKNNGFRNWLEETFPPRRERDLNQSSV